MVLLHAVTPDMQATGVHKFLLLVALLTGLIASACSAPQPTPAVSLYVRLGGDKVIVRVVDEAIDKTAANPVTKRTFDKVDVKKVKQKIVEQICELTGGGCKYSGDNMKLVHQGMDISDAEFFGMVQELRNALDNAGVAQDAKNELLRILAPMKRDIVTK